MLTTKKRRTATLAQTGALLGLDFLAIDFLHWDDTIMHAASRTDIIHTLHVAYVGSHHRCPYCDNVSNLVGLDGPVLLHLLCPPSIYAYVYGLTEAS